MERDVGTLQYPEQVRLMGKKAREQPVQADEACAGAEDPPEALL